MNSPSRRSHKCQKFSCPATTFCGMDQTAWRLQREIDALDTW